MNDEVVFATPLGCDPEAEEMAAQQFVVNVPSVRTYSLPSRRLQRPFDDHADVVSAQMVR